MNDTSLSQTESHESLLARLCEEFSERLCRGEQVDVEQFASRWPRFAAELRELLPTMQLMADIEQARVVSPDVSSWPASNEPLGDFRILREVGRGGMGIVYEAEQLSLRRHVALKVLPLAAVLDQRQLRRFHTEAQAAALLHHPHIVPVHGVGCERGVHYYAMQLIDGPTLAQVIREQRIGAGQEFRRADVLETTRVSGGPEEADPDVRAAGPEPGDSAADHRDVSPIQASTAPQGVLSTSRSHRSSAYIQAAVQLGIEVAEALDYAHREGVLHRDIKPGNLLLDGRGKVWVADFGLARIEADPGLTVTGDVVGTLRYMSPEQALGQRAALDGRADVYALGATLYELLTLEPVFPGDDKQALLRQIAFDEPRPPRQLVTQTLGEKHPHAIFVALVMAKAYYDAQLYPKVVDVLEETLDASRHTFGTDDVITLEAMRRLLISYRETGRASPALPLAEDLIDRATRVFGIDDLRTLQVTLVLAQLYREQGRYQQAESLLLGGLENCCRAHGSEHQNSREIEYELGLLYREQGRFSEAEPRLLRVVALYERLQGPEHPDTLAVMTFLASLYHDQGRLDEAEGLLTRVLGIERRTLGSNHPDIIVSMINLGSVYLSQRKLLQSRELCEQALTLCTTEHGADHAVTLNATHNLAANCLLGEDIDRAIALYEQLLPRRRVILGSKHPDTLCTECYLAEAYLRASKLDQALSLAEQCLTARRDTLGREHPHTLRSLNQVGVILRSLKRLDRSISMLEEVVQLQQTVLPPDHPETLTSKANLGASYRVAGRIDEGLRLLIEAYQKGHTQPALSWVGEQLLDTYIMAGKTKEATELTHELLATARKMMSSDSPPLASALAKTGSAFVRLQAWSEAEPILREALAIRQQHEPDTWTTFNTQSMLGGALTGQQKYAEAEPLLVQGYEGLQQRSAEIPPEGQVRLSEALERLVAFYEATGKPEEAVRWRQELESRTAQTPAETPVEQP